MKLGELEIILIEKFSANATKLPTAQEKWFKGDELDIWAYKKFVKPNYLDNFASAFPNIYLQEQYVNLMKVIKIYFTCEGRFSKIYKYHLRLIWKFTESKPMNLPYFVLKSLERMATKVKIQKDNHASSLFHFSLIKILVKHVVERKKMLWSNFIASI